MIYDEKFEVISEEEAEILLNGQDVIILGASTRNEKVLSSWLKGNILFICDKNMEKWGTQWNNIDIVSYDELSNVDVDNVYVFSLIKDMHFIGEILLKYHIKHFLLEQDDFGEKYIDYFVKRRVFEAENSLVQTSKQNFKYINVIPDEKFIVPLVDILKKISNLQEHLFVVDIINGSNWNDRYNLWDFYLEMANEYHNIYVLDDEYCCSGMDITKQLELVKDKFEQCKRIVLHSGVLNSEFGMFFEKHVEWLSQKAVWIPWGAEEGYTDECKYKQNVLQDVAFVVLPKQKEISQGLIDNYNIKMEQWIGSSIHYAPEIFMESKITKETESGTVKILLGTYATPLVLHEEALSFLEKFVNEDIIIYCPLSYGDMEYKKKIMEYGSRLFGKKFICIEEYLSANDLNHLLNEIDVAIMPIVSRCSATVMRILLKKNKKIYVIDKERIWADFVQQGFGFEDFERLKQEKYDEFIYNRNKEKNQNIVDCLFSEEKFLKEWSKLYCCD